MKHAKKQQPARTLTAVQQAVLDSIVNLLRGATGNTVVLLEGLSGMGKSALLNAFKYFQAELDALVFDHDYGLDRIEEIVGQARHYIIPVLPKAMASTEKELGEHLKAYEVRKVVLSGLDEPQTTAFIRKLKKRRTRAKATFQAGLICKYSLGVPLLVEQLMNPGMDEGMAARVAANYLRMNTKRFFKQASILQDTQPYLQLPVPEEVLAALTKLCELRGERVYDSLHLVLNKIGEAAQKGRRHESPLFIASQSEAIYDEGMKGLDARNFQRRAWIEILAPSLRADHYKQIGAAFNYNGYMFDSYIHDGRLEIFGANLRKSYLLIRNSGWKQVTTAREQDDDFVLDKLERAEKSYLSGEMRLTSLQPDSPSLFFAHSHEHEGMTSNPMLLGWALESLFQQLGVPYFADNQSYGARYIYQPTTKQIEIIHTYD